MRYLANLAPVVDVAEEVNNVLTRYTEFGQAIGNLKTLVQTGLL